MKGVIKKISEMGPYQKRVCHWQPCLNVNWYKYNNIVRSISALFDSNSLSPWEYYF